MKHFLIYIILFFVTVSCTSNTILKKPKDLIKKKEMVALLTDLYLAKGMENIGGIELSIDEMEKKNLKAYAWVLKKHNIDTTRFQQSNYYYCSVMDDYEKMYKKVLQNLNDTLGKIEKLDSINNIIKLEKEKKKMKSIKVRQWEKSK